MIGGITAVGAKIGGMIPGLGWLWLPILYLTGATLAVMLVAKAREPRQAALEAEELRQRVAAI